MKARIFYYVILLNILFISIVVVSAHDENLNYANNDVESEPVPTHESVSEQTESADGAQEQPSIKIPYANSPLYLTHLAQTEQYIYQSLLDYEKQLQHRLEILQRLRTDYETSVFAAMQQVERPEDLDDWLRATIVSSHPLLAYRMIRRFSKDLKAFTEHIWQSFENGYIRCTLPVNIIKLWENLELRRNNFAWPSQEDLQAVTKSLIRLQDTHDFDIHHFAAGVIRDHYVQVGLTARQCLEISETALGIGEINSAVEWFQAAHYKGVNGHDNTLSMDELTQAWERTYQEFRSIWPMQIFTTHDVFTEAKELLRNDFNRLKWNLTEEHIPINFKALCRGEKLLTDLTCYFERTIHPYNFINPLKIEMYNWNPLLYKVHDFIGAKTIGSLGNIVVPSMTVSAEADGATITLKAENWRKTHTSSELLDSVSWSLSTLTQRINQLSAFYIFQLNTVPSDKYQISAFAVGNHYEPCVECFKVENAADAASTGRVISTAHIVLHAPEKGGELAFPLLGVAVTPSVGSVIVVDLYGNFDERSIHGSCPVLIGEKWIATKLIYDVSK